MPTSRLKIKLLERSTWEWLFFIAIEAGDNHETADKIIQKLLKLRIFSQGER